MIYGDVTGVGYRYFVRKNANSLGLAGFVRNVRTGEVEAVFEGEEAKVAKMVELCRRGPAVAWVSKIEEKWEEAKGDFKIFEVKY